MIAAKLEVTLKVQDRPTKIADAANGWRTFAVDCDGREVRFTLRPKLIAKFDEAEKKGLPWVASIAGKMGAPTARGFELDEPVVQVFERRPKDTATA